MGFNKIDTIDAIILGGVSAGAYKRTPWMREGYVTDNDGLEIGRRYVFGDREFNDVWHIREAADCLWEPVEIDVSDLIIPTVVGTPQTNIRSSSKMLVRPGWPTPTEAFQLGIHSQKYGTLDNATGYGFVEELIRIDGTWLESAFSLYGGRVNVVVIGLGQPWTIGRIAGDTAQSYVWVFWSHDGTHPLGAVYANTVAVCENTFNLHGTRDLVKIRHTTHAADHADEARRTFRSMIESETETKEKTQRLLDITIETKSDFADALREVIGERPTAHRKGRAFLLRAQKAWDKQASRIIDEWHDYTGGQTAFDFVMAVQGAEQHRVAKRSNSDPLKPIKRVIGTNFPMTAKALAVFV